MEMVCYLFNSDGLGYRQMFLEPKRIRIDVDSASPGARCPVCGYLSRRVHSRYVRILSDLPWQGTPVQLHMTVRRFFCDTSGCPRSIFVERLGPVARRYARKTIGLVNSLRAIGFALGGEAGARLAGRLGMPTSGDTLLNLIRRAPLPRRSAPTVLGLDDWAWRRGFRYGTLLCDLEKHRPIDLLPSRDKDVVANWLKGHSGIGIISRDRAGDYAHAIGEGAPQARSVADRWHLIHNLCETLTRILDQHHRELREISKIHTALKSRSPPDVPLTPSYPCSIKVTRSQTIKEERRARRLKRYQEVIELYREGKSYRSIARQLNLHRMTVARYVQAGSFPEHAGRFYKSQTRPFDEILRLLWNEGNRNAVELTRELRMKGFTGSYWSVKRRVAFWRSEPSGFASPENSVPRSCPSSKQVARWFLANPAELESDVRTFLNDLWSKCPFLERTAELSREFKDIIHDRLSQKLESWIQKVLNLAVPPEFKRFARGLEKDEAVKAALELPWSNGQVEGQINRLKLIKRQMYGRAGFDLLRRRVLHRG